MFDDRTLERWLSLEMRRMQQGIVRSPRPLQELLHEADPSAPTAPGQHRFDAEALRGLAGGLTPLQRATLRLPILFYLDHETPGDCYVADAASADAIQALGQRLGAAREGRWWISVPLAKEFARRWPTLVQFVQL